MKITDLTHLIHSEMAVYPGTEQPVFQVGNTLEDDGFVEARITMFSHTGTHIDAPAHLLKNGSFLDELPIDHYVGNANILDFSDLEGSIINVDKLQNHEKMIQKADFIILKTGWEKYWGKHEYFENFPTLSKESALWLSDFNLKGIGLDAISIDKMTSTSFEIHKIFLSKNTIIIENLTNLDAIESDSFILSVMPLKNKNADGSPVRAYSMEF
jgi:kynurenine formamidase